MESQGADFRRQLGLPQQRQLFDYWLSLSKEGTWPRVEHIHPAEIRSLLGNLLLLEMRPLPEGVCVRLAGSETWDIYGGELTGATLTQGRWGRHAGYWRRVYAGMHESPLPQNGHLPRFNGRAHMTLFWLRLPMRHRDGNIWLLGLDLMAALVDEDAVANDAGEEVVNDMANMRVTPHLQAPHLSSDEPRPQVVLRRRRRMPDEVTVID